MESFESSQKEVKDAQVRPLRRNSSRRRHRRDGSSGSIQIDAKDETTNPRTPTLRGNSSRIRLQLQGSPSEVKVGDSNSSQAETPPLTPSLRRTGSRRLRHQQSNSSGEMSFGDDSGSLSEATSRTPSYRRNSYRRLQQLQGNSSGEMALGESNDSLSVSVIKRASSLSRRNSSRRSMESSQGSSLTTDTMSSVPKRHHIPNISRKRQARNRAIEQIQEDQALKGVIDRVLKQHPPKQTRSTMDQVENNASETSIRVDSLAEIQNDEQYSVQEEGLQSEKTENAEYSLGFKDKHGHQDAVNSLCSNYSEIPRMGSIATAVVNNCSDNSVTSHHSNSIVTAVISNRTQKPSNLVPPDKFQALQSTIEQKLLSRLGEEDTIDDSAMVNEEEDGAGRGKENSKPRGCSLANGLALVRQAVPGDRNSSPTVGQHCRKSLPLDDDRVDDAPTEDKKHEPDADSEDQSVALGVMQTVAPSIGRHLRKNAAQEVEDEDNKSQSIDAPSQHHCLPANDDGSNQATDESAQSPHSTRLRRRSRSRSRGRRRRKSGSYAPPKTLVESPRNESDEDDVDLVQVRDQYVLDANSKRIGRFTGSIDKRSGMPHGKNAGRMEYPGATSLEFESYEGDWDQGSWTGYGRHEKANGDVYNGEFLFNVKHGTGIYTYRDGRRTFQGRYRDGHRVEGKMTYGDGSVYIGAWFNGQRHGRGLYTFGDGTSYEGEFQKDMLDGMGTLTFPDGFSFVGEFRAGKRHGHGKEFRSDGTLDYDGIWKEGVPM